MLTVSEQSGKLLFDSGPLTATAGVTITDLAVPIPKVPLTNDRWTEVGRRMVLAGLTRLSDLVDQLVYAPNSIFADWTVTERQNAVTQLEAAFLDPSRTLDDMVPLPSWQQLSASGGLAAYRQAIGARMQDPVVGQAFSTLSAKVTQLGSLGGVDWTVEPANFGKGLGTAVTINQAIYVGSKPAMLCFLPNPEMRYRDYLRAQWTSMVTLVEYIQPYQLTVPQAEQQLTNRFHQDFRTSDTASVPANEILVPILTAILTAPPGSTFGFGLSPSSVPPRGGAGARQYLDTLIGLTGLSALELTLRYRTDFTRPDTAMSTPIWENIHTLQGFFRDSFQSVVDPADAAPDVFTGGGGPAQPIIPDQMQGKAPFFLEYGEWLLLQQPSHYENEFQIRQVFQVNVSDSTKQMIQSWASSSQPTAAIFKLMQKALDIQDQLAKGYAFLDEGEYQAALDIFHQVYSALPVGPAGWGGVDVNGNFAARRKRIVKSMADLYNLSTMWHVEDYETGVGIYPDQWARFYQTNLVCSLVYLDVFLLPTLIAQASLGLGDYPTAVLYFGRAAFFLVGKATTSDMTAYRDDIQFLQNSWPEFQLYHAGNLPYTVDTDPKMTRYPILTVDDSGSYVGPILDSSIQPLIPGGMHQIEQSYFKLQMGGAMLDWADALFRSEDDSSVARARELYKGVYFLYGAIPPINPSWNAQGLQNTFFPACPNPAVTSQLARAELGFTLINAGLNFFGYADDMVPILRYSTLKSAADRFAAQAKAAEQDFLAFMGQIEQATTENMKNAAIIQKAGLNSQIAQQQANIAQDQVKQAQNAVTQVNNQISSAQQDIANHDSFWGELGDYLSGMTNIVNGLPSWFTQGATAGTGAVTGVSSADTSGLLGLGVGASAFAGFVAFGVASYMTISSMASAQSQRASALNTLQNQTLPSAQAQVDIAQRSVTIANLQQQVAASDAELASELLTFANDRYLSIEFWSNMAWLARRILRQFIDLATRMGWLAERALSYEQGNDVNIIHMDYTQESVQGAGGPDRLILDLGELEAQRLDGLKEMIPIKHTFSMARDFPLQFAQLVSTGHCSFLTQESPLQLAYLGTFGYRIVAVTPTLNLIAANAPVRGLLSNTGISLIGEEDGTTKVSIRPQDALPVSEFKLDTPDMQVFALPGGTLMQFEGSGIDTVWSLDFPAAANQAGLGNVADILLTMDIRAQYSLSLSQSQIQNPPTSLSKFVFVSAAKLGSSGLADLQGKSTTATVAFDMTAIGLPPQEKSRTLNNIAFLVIGATNAATIAASVSALKPSPQNIAVSLDNGAAYSNMPPITDPQSTVSPSPLNALAGDPVDQTFSLVIDKTANSGVDFGTVQDVLIGVDYTATV